MQCWLIQYLNIIFKDPSLLHLTALPSPCISFVLQFVTSWLQDSYISKHHSIYPEAEKEAFPIFRTNKTFLRIPSADVPSCLFTYSFIMYSPCLNQLLARGIGECTKLDKIYQDLALSHGGKSRYLNRIRILLIRKRKGEGRLLLRRQPKASSVTANWITTKEAQHKWFFSSEHL